eukprot:6717962-Alexandrium_andersonii.AAC.1
MRDGIYDMRNVDAGQFANRHVPMFTAAGLRWPRMGRLPNPTAGLGPMGSGSDGVHTGPNKQASESELALATGSLARRSPPKLP